MQASCLMCRRRQCQGHAANPPMEQHGSDDDNVNLSTGSKLSEVRAAVSRGNHARTVAGEAGVELCARSLNGDDAVDAPEALVARVHAQRGTHARIGTVCKGAKQL